MDVIKQIMIGNNLNTRVSPFENRISQSTDQNLPMNFHFSFGVKIKYTLNHFEHYTTIGIILLQNFLLSAH